MAESSVPSAGRGATRAAVLERAKQEASLALDRSVPASCRSYETGRAVQVGVNDFHLENLGRIKQAVFHPESNKRRIFVTSVRPS